MGGGGDEEKVEGCRKRGEGEEEKRKERCKRKNKRKRTFEGETSDISRTESNGTLFLSCTAAHKTVTFQVRPMHRGKRVEAR